ncbi:MAG: hypothetical protein WD396_00235 [Pseudohongiellaceae bacterium]
MFKKHSHSLFAEEETYNWATPKPNRSKLLIYLAVFFMITAVLFSALR